MPVVKRATHVGNDLHTLGQCAYIQLLLNCQQSTACMQVCSTGTTLITLTASLPESTPTTNSPQARNFPGTFHPAAASQALKQTETTRPNIKHIMTHNRSKLLFNRFLSALPLDSVLPEQALCPCFG